jgi:ribonuclease HI
MMEFVITCDGGSRGNGTEVAHGYGSYMINAPGNIGNIHSLDFGGGITNNEAEYKALIGALNHISGAFLAVAADLKTIKLTIRTDSQLVVGHLSKGWKIKAHNLIPLAVKASSLCSQFASVEFEQISGEEMKSILGH